MKLKFLAGWRWVAHHSTNPGDEIYVRPLCRPGAVFRISPILLIELAPRLSRGAGMRMSRLPLEALDTREQPWLRSASLCPAHSSRGPGRRPLTAVTRVRIPYALPELPLAARTLREPVGVACRR